MNNYSVVIDKKTGALSYSPWIRRGGMLLNREALDSNDPDHLYNAIISAGGNPTDYGIANPYAERYADKTREQLIDLVEQYKREIESIYRDGGK